MLDFKDAMVRNQVVEQMLMSFMPHFKAFDFDECKKIGLPVRCANQDEVELFEYSDSISNYQ